MTNNDYELVAKAMRESAPRKEAERERYQWSSTVFSLSSHFTMIDSSFDRASFVQLCGVDS